MERASIILARLYWTLAAIGSFYNLAFPGHPLSILGWIAHCATLVTCALCWLSYPWAWMTAGFVGFIALAYESYVLVLIWLAMAFAGGGEPTFTVSFGPIHITGLVAKILMPGLPLFGFIVTTLLAYFGARRSDAKNKV